MGHIKVKNKLTLRLILGDLKHFKTMFFSIKGAGRVGLDPYLRKIPLFLFIYFSNRP